MTFDDTWRSSDQHNWNQLLKDYWSLLLPDNIQIEYLLNRLRPADVQRMNEKSWYNFLHDQYFVWKYTAKNRLATTRAQLQKYKNENALHALDDIRQEIVALDVNDVGSSLKAACQVRGLGVAGASGLLSLIYPEHFATVDQFVVRALAEVHEHSNAVRHMNPEGLKIADGIVLTEILREKASSMNAQYGSQFWTPRTLEMAIWAYRS